MVQVHIMGRDKTGHQIYSFGKVFQSLPKAIEYCWNLTDSEQVLVERSADSSFGYNIYVNGKWSYDTQPYETGMICINTHKMVTTNEITCPYCKSEECYRYMINGVIEGIEGDDTV